MSKKRYDPGYIREALKLADEVGVKEAARRLGMPVSTLSHWKTGKAAGQANKPESDDPRDMEIKELDEQINALAEANDLKDQEIEKQREQIEILKAAIFYFGLDRKD